MQKNKGVNRIHSRRRTPLFSHFICSLLLHVMGFSLLLFIPIQSGGASGELPGEYFIFLKNEEPGVNAEGMRRAAAAETETAANPAGMSTEASEDLPENSTPEKDTEKAALTGQEGKDSEAVKATGVKETPFAASPGDATERISAAEGKRETPLAPEDERTAHPDSPQEDVNGGKTVQAGMQAEKNVPILPRIQEPMKAADISPERALSVSHNKAVLPAAVQLKEKKTEPAREKMPAPTVEQKKPDTGARPQTKQPPAGTGQNRRQHPDQNAGPKPALHLPAPAMTAKEIPASSGPKEMTPHIPPEDIISKGQEIPASDGNIFQDRFGGLGFSPGITVSTPAAETVYANEKDASIIPPAFEAKYTGKNNDGRVDERMAKKDAEASGKVGPPESAAAPVALQSKKKPVSEEFEKGRTPEPVKGNILKEHPFLTGSYKDPAAEKDATGAPDAQASASAAAAAKEKKADHKGNPGGEKKAVKALSQAGQKNGEAAGTKNALPHQANGQPEKGGEGGQQERGTGLKTHAGKKDSFGWSNGIKSDRNGAGHYPEMNQNGQSAFASGAAAGRTSAEGDENRVSVSQSDVGSRAKAGDPEARTVPGILSLAKPYNGKGNETKLNMIADPANESKKSSFGILAPEILNQKDIRIEVLLKSGETTGVFMQLFRKSYPGQHRRDGRDKQEQTEATAEQTVMKSPDKAALKHLVSVAHAEKAVYIFVLENKDNKPCDAAIEFYLYEGKEKERVKKYNSVEIVPGGRLRFKFIMPEAFFWDDDERFSGNAEDSKAITKFHYESGLVWREEKDPPIPAPGVNPQR